MAAYPFVEVSVRPEAEELAGTLLLDQGARGIETRDGSTLTAARAPGAVTLLGYFDTHEDAAAAARQIRKALGPSCLEARADEAEDPGWRLAWRDYFRPMCFGGRLWVAPPGEPLPAAAGAEAGAAAADLPVITLLPSVAFGTGTHETTSLMLELLVGCLRAGARVLDVGTGSGILALAALRLGAARARGIDVDEDAVAAARENARDNRLASRARFDATPLARVRASYDLVLANLSFRELLPLAHLLPPRIAPDGLLIWSGLLAPEVRELPPPAGLSLVETRHRGEWAAQVFSRPPRPATEDS